MAVKRKSIIEEALLEAKTLEDALKANTKEMLSAHMSKEIENIVESTLREQEEEVEDDIELGSDDDELGMDDIDLDIDDDVSVDDVDLDLDSLDLDDDTGEEEEVDLDLDTDLDLDAGEEGLELNMDDMDMGDMDLELPSTDLMGMMGDDDEVFDMRNEPDGELLKVFKGMDDNSTVEVMKDDSGIFLKDNDAGTEYFIKESMEMGDEGLCSECGSGSMNDEDLMYEIELDEDDDMYEMIKNMKGRDYDDDEYYYYPDDYDGDDDLYEGLSRTRGGARQGNRRGRDYDDDEYYYYPDDYDGDDDLYEGDDDLEEGLSRTRGGARQGNRRGGASHNPKPKGRGRFESTKPRRTLNRKSKGKNMFESTKPRRTLNKKRNNSNVKSKGFTNRESKILKEYKELKSKNEQYKKALNIFKGKLNEVALFNTNLAYVNRLFTEHSTTKKEKMGILKRFDTSESIKESKNIYKTIKTELDRKISINESVGKKVNKTIKSSQGKNLNESTAYVDPQIAAIKDLMRRIS
jgi:hypothetical protein